MNITLTYFDGVEVKVETIEHTKPPQVAGPVVQFFDEFNGNLRSLFLMNRVVRMDFEESSIVGATQLSQ